MARFTSVLAFVCITHTVVAFKEFPSAIERCQFGNSSCLAQLITKILHDYPDGAPELGLAAMDPLYFGNITVSQGGSGPVSMVLSLFESSIHGWRDAVVTKVVGFDKDPKTSKFEMHVKVPFDVISGLYDMSGRALLIPIRGMGKANMSFTELEMEVKFVTSVVNRDNEDYLKIKKVQLDISCKSMHTQFENLFNDAQLSKNINAVLNANAMVLFNEVRGSFGKARGKIVQNLISPLFDQFPYRTLFAD